jgi:phthiocerol/phenolphthiocerol synthesis type-I polyketide synthase D
LIAVVRGSAAGHDGRSASLTAPNGVAQQAVMRAALKDAGMSGADLDYVEAHGVGTVLGDPIEIEAVTSVCGLRKHPVTIGSVKTNLGHLEAAAGVAALQKVALSLHPSTAAASSALRQPQPDVRVNDERLRHPTYPSDVAG